MFFFILIILFKVNMVLNKNHAAFLQVTKLANYCCFDAGIQNILKYCMIISRNRHNGLLIL